MTNFNADPRVRDLEPDTTGLGPNFPSSLNDLWRMVFRASDEYLRYVKLAVSNDNGTPVGQNVEKAVAAFQAAALAELAAINAALVNPLRVSIVKDMEGRRITARTYQVAVATSGGTLIASENPNRRSILITNVTGTQPTYYGFGSAPTATNGGYLHSAAGSNVELNTQLAIWGLSITAAQTLTVTEEEYLGE